MTKPDYFLGIDRNYKLKDIVDNNFYEDLTNSQIRSFEDNSKRMFSESDI